MSETLLKLERTAEEVIDLVKDRLIPYQPAKYTLEVLPNVTHKEGQWWYVIVRASQTNFDVSDYNARIEKIERDLQKMDKVNVVLLPNVPEWMKGMN